MSTTLGIDFDADLAEIQSDIAQTITYSGSSYAATVSAAQSGYRVETPDGYYADIQIQVLVRSSLFGTLPSEGETLIYQGTTYRIVRVNKDVAFGFVMLDCEEQSA